MNVAGERILIFGDSLTHHGTDFGPEIWDLDVAPISSQPGDVLAGLLAQAGAQAVRTDANVGRSARNFFAGPNSHQRNTAADLLASDTAFAPTKVIIFLGTNDADQLSPSATQADPAAMTQLRDTFVGMGAEVIAIGPPVFADQSLTARANVIYEMMSDVFGSNLIDARPLSSTVGRAGDSVHFGQAAAVDFANQLLPQVQSVGGPIGAAFDSVGATTPTKKWALAGGVALAILGVTWFFTRRKGAAALHGAGAGVDGHVVVVDGKRWNGTRNELVRSGARKIKCASGIKDLECWEGPTARERARGVGTPGHRREVAKIADDLRKTGAKVTTIYDGDGNTTALGAAHRTYATAKVEIFDELTRAGWTLSSRTLKTPHATSPDGSLRIWFKPQAIHFTRTGPGSSHVPGETHHRHDAGEARAISYDLDTRKLTPEEFRAVIQRRFPGALTSLP